ncbi:dephospho-CoA kinase [Halobacillus andaensis]|uniref:Dephospho-CoA kinase n=1 Tax=Halobacillus andaensis TaxID=1176239 RepID=A0A917ES57_HALAA|nr:dephospho-CoA kinase [Halobacillus andaensis]MBP2002875.1 dephospho-CoA kinase [Halobacillus andaensis]GGF06313.1 dephospho-CoA kinase [Halobacillus andaensis]
MGIIIGLTGSIATGKSTISKMFDSFNIPVVDADVISREVVEIGRPAYQQIVDCFGEKVLHEDRTLNRKQLGSIIFKDETKRKQLNEIVHPEVRKQMLEQRDGYLNEGNKAVVLDIPLLFESDLAHFADRTLVVYVDEETQLKRLMDRDGSSKEDALERIRSQIPIQEKAERADEVIDNSGTIEESFQQLKRILTEWNVLKKSD